MPEFLCKVGTVTGKIFERSYEAESEAEVRERLHGKKYHIFSIRKRSAFLLVLQELGRGKKRVKLKDFLLFNQEFVALLRAGLPIIQGLEILLERMEDTPFKAALLDVREQVKSGTSLSDAFASHGEMFPEIYSASLLAGEKSGNLDEVLARYVGYVKQIQEVQKKIISAMIYPVVLFVLMVLVIGVLMIYVLPNFADFYSGFKATLPLPTRVLMGISTFSRENIIVVFLGIIIVVVGLRYWRKTARGRRLLDQWKLRAPLVGDLAKKYWLAQLTRTLSILLRGGIPLVDALKVTAGAVRNEFILSRMRGIVQKIREGENLAESFEEAGFATSLTVEMIKVGEASGSLEEMLTHVADFYDEEIDYSLTRFVALFEPVALVVLAIVVAAMLVAMYLPLFELVQVAG